MPPPEASRASPLIVPISTWAMAMFTAARKINGGLYMVDFSLRILQESITAQRVPSLAATGSGVGWRGEMGSSGGAEGVSFSSGWTSKWVRVGIQRAAL